MAIIAFWSNSLKPTGQTMSAVAMATYMGIEHNYKVLFLTTVKDDNSLELCFGQNKNVASVFKKEKNAVTLDSGIEGLAQIASSSRLTPDMITNYTKIVFKDRLEVIYGYKSRHTEEDQVITNKINNELKKILLNATQYYDMIFIDLEKGTDSEMTKEILKIADVVVVNVEQKLNMINDFIELNTNNKDMTKKTILNIGRYDRFSKYNIKNISRYTGMKKNISTVPYNTQYFEAAGEETVADFFLRVRSSDQFETNGIFCTHIKDDLQKIIYKIQELQLKA